MTKILDGRKVAKVITEKVKEDVTEIRDRVRPKLAVITCKKDPAAEIYLRKKEEACKDAGILFSRYDFPKASNTAEIVAKVRELNEDVSVHGVLVQLPLPDQIDRYEVINEIDAGKDVDGFSHLNLGRLAHKTSEGFIAATPLAVMKVVDYYKIPVEGKEVTIVGTGDVVGKPLAVLFLNRDATITVCHRKTKDLRGHTKRADILVSATGVPRLITKDMVKKSAVVIDVGISRVKGKIAGDVDFDNVSKVAGAITPVPGGIGPVTIACLLENTLLAAKRTV